MAQQSVKLCIVKDPETKEWKVTHWVNGTPIPRRTAFTEDFLDAWTTYGSEKDWYKSRGFKVEGSLSKAVQATAKRLGLKAPEYYIKK